ncbi:MAG TPA: hypothetical protein VLW65_15675 [Bryobacteraceae bacterium]|nr:hypothetical protein [Bryobacteraceae bacterium]
MVLREICGRRALLVLSILCLMVWAQSAALSLEHSEHHSSEHCCLLCHAGPLPFLQTTPSGSVAPVVPLAWFAPPAEIQDTHDVLMATSSSRAPPA